LLLIVLHNTVTDSAWPLSNCTQAKYNSADRCLRDPPDRNLELPIVELLRGSTAAPIYFQPQRVAIGEYEFVFQDGGITPFNNPAFLLYLMATVPRYGLGWPSGAEQLLLVSVGTGAASAVHPGLRPGQVKLLFNARNLPSVFMNGASVGQDLLCRATGRCRFGEMLDREVGDLVEAALPRPPAFTYLRYNADLSDEALAGFGFSPRTRARLRKLDAVDRVDDLRRLGRKVGDRIDLDDHFRGFV
jgi:hypothetical protein